MSIISDDTKIQKIVYDGIEVAGDNDELIIFDNGQYGTQFRFHPHQSGSHSTLSSYVKLVMCDDGSFCVQTAGSVGSGWADMAIDMTDYKTVEIVARTSYYPGSGTGYRAQILHGAIDAGAVTSITINSTDFKLYTIDVSAFSGPYTIALYSASYVDSPPTHRDIYVKSIKLLK